MAGGDPPATSPELQGGRGNVISAGDRMAWQELLPPAEPGGEIFGADPAGNGALHVPPAGEEAGASGGTAEGDVSSPAARAPPPCGEVLALLTPWGWGAALAAPTGRAAQLGTCARWRRPPSTACWRPSSIPAPGGWGLCPRERASLRIRRRHQWMGTSLGGLAPSQAGCSSPPCGTAPPEGATVGDPDQLPSVGPGAPVPSDPHPQRGHPTVRLTEIFPARPPEAASS